MRGRRECWFQPSVFVFIGLTFWASNSLSGTGEQGFSQQGFSQQGFSQQGFSQQGFSQQGFSQQGFSQQGVSQQGFSQQGFSQQGFSQQGFSQQGYAIQGFSQQGFSQQGFSQQGFNLAGPQLLGIDRLRGLAGSMELRGIQYAFVQTPAGISLQGIQQLPPSITYVELPSPPAGIQLQAGPGGAETGSGTFIYVPDGSGGAKDLRGTFWNLLFADSTGEGAIGLYVSDWGKDTATNLSKYPSNDDVYLYTVYYRHPATQQWTSLCPVDPITGKASAMAIPLDPSDWTSPASRQKFTFACTATGVGSKCARNWGYKPWKTVAETVWTGAGFAAKAVPLKPFYDACLIAARADYCQDGQSYTKNGTLVDLFDTLDGFTSINPTAGLPYTPGSPGPMMHEEYQISALDLASLDALPVRPFYAIVPAEDLMSLSPEDQAKAAVLRRSGMQSSRYDDLDPGRACFAAPYIDRCDPREPYACYRDTNMSATPYGAFLAVNSPRHCDHDEATAGAPLDPLCNLCVTRVCSVDPTCCGDPGDTFYPGSLVWDARCTAIRNNVCRSGPSDPLWGAGKVATPAASKKVSYLRGTVGSFEGIVGAAPNLFVEGWACDPDFPGASAPIQISVGGPMGAAGTRLITARADQPLAAGWRDAVAAECGGTGAPGRHGFRVALLSSEAGKDVYVYGIDLNVPGAPFTLLRGGLKPIPSKVPPAPRSAIWSGWLEPTVTGTYTFTVGATPDSYRVWVNGTYVAGKNWSDPAGPGAFVAPTPAPQVPLVAGGRYGVRVEYLRTSATNTASAFALRWQPPGSPAPVDIPSTALYPVAPTVGEGLVGTTYRGDFSGPQDGPAKVAPVDFLWTTSPGQAPGPTITVKDAFAARFAGQVIPPVSGDYTFSADTDGAVTIWVDNQLVTDLSRGPPVTDADTCTHDICGTGAAISRTCKQGYFCAAQICLKDPACCAQTWDAQCLQEVATICHLDCRPTPPISVSLRAGVRYDIKVELKHAANPDARGAKLRLFWALAGGARDTIPASRLFAAATAAGKGVGLNAAFFSDVFTTPTFDRVVDQLSFSGASLPTVSRATMVCPGAGTTACPAGNDALGALALVAPTPNAEDPGARVANTNGVVVQGGGVVTGATVTLSEGATTFATTTDAAGLFKTAALALAPGNHVLTAVQSGPAAASPPTVLKLVVVDGSLTAPPAVTGASGGLSASNGRLTIGGTAAPNATVTISGPAGSTTVTADASGKWTTAASSPYVLAGPGAYTLTVTQSGGGSTTVTAKYALPPLTVSQPATADQVVPASFTVTGSSPLAGGQIVVADGDGRYFVERAENKANVNANGTFTVNVGQAAAFDPGRHVLKIFQRSNGLDGDAVMRSVLVSPAPPPASMTITRPTELARVDNQVVIEGVGAPVTTGLRYAVAVYQGTGIAPSIVWTKVGQADVDDTGAFALTVKLAGVGKTQLGLSLLVRSLSGGGAAESQRGSFVRNVVIAPPAPTLSKPNPNVNPFAQSSTTLAVAGSGASGAQIAILLDGSPLALSPALVVASGSFSRNVTVPKGVHVLTVTQKLDGQESAATPGQLLRIGDVVPPQITVARPNDQPPPTSSDTGANVDVVALRGITAVDVGGTTPLAVTCYPAAASLLPVGTTQVVCTAKDVAGNVASTTQAVTVRSSATPVVTGNSIIAEATGPQGAAVAYQVSATGSVADCAPPGSSEIVPCSSWRPVNTGLGFHVSTIAVDPKDGALYASADDDPNGDSDGRLFKSTDQGGSWTRLSLPGPPRMIPTSARLGIAPGVLSTDPSTLYIPTRNGLLASKGGAPATMLLSGIDAGGVSVDPNDARHILSWNLPSPGRGPIVLFETRNGGQTWSLAAGIAEDASDIDNPHITDVVFDRLNPGRVYAQVAPWQRSDPNSPERVYRRLGTGPWVRLAVPPVQYANERWAEAALAVAPSLPPCGGAVPCQTFATVFAAGAMSIDGGENWAAVPGLQHGLDRMVFDSRTPGRIVAFENQESVVSVDFGRSFEGLSSHPYGWFDELIQDPVQGAVFYALSGSSLLKSGDGGTSWSAVKAPGSDGMARTILDVAASPVDSRVAYMLATDGFYRTGDGGDSWTLATNGIAPERDIVVTKKYGITIDPFNSQTVYLSGIADPLVWTDRPDQPLLPWTSAPGWGFLAADPSAANVFFTTSHSDASVSLISQGVSRGYALNLGGQLEPVTIQVFPDAARTVAVTYTTWPAGGTFLFSARTAQLAPSQTNVVTALSGSPAKPLFDNSEGRDNLFASGDALGSVPSLLYKASLADASVRGNAAFTAIGGGQPGIDFRRLVIDRGSGGQVMYTVGMDEGLWQSNDGGVTWTEDDTVPGAILRVWSSPLDGAVYASESNNGISEDNLQGMLVRPASLLQDQRLWKRAPASAPPAGASIVNGDLRVVCTKAGATRAFTSGSVFPLGATALTCTATDVFKGTGTLGLTIDVRDRTPPLINVVPPAPVNVASSDPNVVVPVTFVVTANDAVDGTLTPSPTWCAPRSGSAFRVGVTTVTCTVADTRGNAASVSFPVTVTRNGQSSGAPTLNVPANLTVEGTILGGARPNPVVTGTKASGGALATPPTCSPVLSSTFAVGMTTVTCSAVDAGITVTRSFTVTVTDTRAPTIAVPSLASVASQGAAGARVPFTVTATDVVDGCIAPSTSALAPGATPPCVPAANAGVVTCVPASNSMFARGRTTVSCRANDKAGNIAAAKFDVVVNDVSPPVVTAPSLLLVEAQDSIGARAVYAVSATDPEDGTVPVDCAPVSGSWFPPGDSSVACQATDSAGNTSRATFTVRITDSAPPALTLPTVPLTFEATTAVGAAATFTVKAFDLVSQAVTPACTRPNGINPAIAVVSGDVLPMGRTVVTCAASDGAGNIVTDSFEVNVVDSKGPVLTLPSTRYAQADGGGAAIVTFNVTATDLGVAAAVACTPRSGSRFLFGTTAVTCVARDSAGNETRGTFSVIVRDTVAPTISSAANKTAYATTTAGAVVTYTLPTATDGVDGPRPVTCAPASGATFPPAVTAVTCSATDTSGNTRTRTFTVSVTYDTRQPDGSTFTSGFAANGSSLYVRNAPINVAFALTGVSSPITNLVARAQVAPVSAGVPGTFVDATPVSGSGNAFAYNPTTRTYGFAMATAALVPGSYRFRADLGDGAPREVNFTISDKSITMTPGSFVFGSVVIPQQGNVAGFVIRNIGATATTLTVGVDGQPMGTADFPIIRNTCLSSVPAGGTCNVDVAFRGNNPAGPKHAMFTVTASDGSSLTAPLDGVAWRPAQLVLEAPATNFGAVPLLTPSALGVTVRNLGDAPSGTMNVQLAGADFAIASSTCPPTLLGLQACTLTIRFAPTALGARSAMLTVGASPGGSPPGVTFTGVGLQPLSASPASLTFARTIIGRPGDSLVITVRNISTAPSGALTTTVSPSQFRVTSNTCGSLAGGGATCSVTIQWFPTADATIGGSFNITGAGGWSASATLSGTGVPEPR